MSEPEFETIRLLDDEGHIRSLVEIERDAITFAMHNERSMKEVARRLGIGRSTLYRRWNEYKNESRKPSG